MTTARFDADWADGDGRDTQVSAMDQRRRAFQLCLGAEPHATVVPCEGHLHQALRQLSLVRARHQDPG